MYGGSALLIGKGIDLYLVGYHESGVEAQAEMADDLILAGFVFVFLQEIRSAGKGDLVDVFLHLVGGHADSVVDHLDGLVRGVDTHLHLGLIALRQGIFADHI